MISWTTYLSSRSDIRTDSDILKTSMRRHCHDSCVSLPCSTLTSADELQPWPVPRPRATLTADRSRTPRTVTLTRSSSGMSATMSCFTGSMLPTPQDRSLSPRREPTGRPVHMKRPISWTERESEDQSHTTTRYPVLHNGFCCMKNVVGDIRQAPCMASIRDELHN
jgi:hypothetical protein